MQRRATPRGAPLAAAVALLGAAALLRRAAPFGFAGAPGGAPRPAGAGPREGGAARPFAGGDVGGAPAAPEPAGAGGAGTLAGALAGAGALAAAGLVRRQGRRRSPSGPPRSSGLAAAAAEGAEAGAAPSAPAKPKKVRITAFDSVRFFLIAYIVCGHFISFAAPSKFAIKAITQINVVVGAFFALSGYVAAYTTTENAAREPSPKLVDTPKPLWILQRVFGYWPLHLLMCLLFLPMFMYPDVLFSGWPTAIWHGFLAVTMTQAWFPMHAEVWNAPTWFLSALTFATAVLPFALPIFAKQTKPQLRRTFGLLFLVGLLPKLGYCYDCNAWGALEGAMSPRSFPNLAIFNNQRFNPFYCTIEVLLGAVACRLVMLDGAEGETKAPKVNALSTALPIAGMLGVVLLRAMGVLHLSDMLTRACVFMPLFLSFLMASHRASVLPKVTDPICKILSSKLLVTLGNLAFPIFIVHGPLGQLFYKKIIATKLFGGPLHVLCGPWFFYVYLAIVVAFAWVVQKTFLANKAVGATSKNVCGKLAAAL